MHSVESLIDDAVKICGSASELARRLGVHRQEVSEWRSGKRRISPETVAYLGDILKLNGAEVRELAAWAVVASAKTPERAGVLRRAFFAVLGTGAVSTTPQDGPTAETATSEQAASVSSQNLTVYIMSSLAGCIRRVARGCLRTHFAPTLYTAWCIGL